jgi:hypothetical protein
MIKNNKITKIIIDIFGIIAMIGCWVSTDTAKVSKGHFGNEQDIASSFSWGTLHSIVSIAFTVLLIIHLCQHWKFIKGIVKKHLYLRNKVTTITLITFVVTILSFLLFLTGFNRSLGEFHGTAANIFLITCCIHLVFNFKKMLILFKGTIFRNDSWIYNYASRSNDQKAVSVLSPVFPPDSDSRKPS